MNAKRDPEEVLGSIFEPTNLDDEIEGVLAMTPEQRRAELEAAGFDMKAVHAKADEFLAKTTEAADATANTSAMPTGTATATATATPTAIPSPTSIKSDARTPRPPRRRPMAAIIAAGVTAAAAGGVIVANLGGPPGVGKPPPDPGAVRREGLDACNDRSWQQCLEKLNRARELDPEGDRAAEVQEARRAAEDALHPKPPPAPTR